MQAIKTSTGYDNLPLSQWELGLSRTEEIDFQLLQMLESRLLRSDVLPAVADAAGPFSK